MNRDPHAPMNPWPRPLTPAEGSRPLYVLELRVDLATGDQALELAEHLHEAATKWLDRRDMLPLPFLVVDVLIEVSRD